MSAVAEMAEALRAALRGVEGVRHLTDAGESSDPPATTLGPPSLTWSGDLAEPREATFPVALVVPADERAFDRLWTLLPLVAAALDGVPDVVVRRAEPGTYPAGGVELPAYLIEVETAL